MIETPEQRLYRLRETYPIGWIKNHEIKTSNGFPFEFRNHAFMIDPMNDMSPLQVWLKPPQIGASETQIVKSFYVAKKKHKDIIYTLPTATDVNDMAGGKINRLVAQNPILQEWVKGHDTVEQKSVDENIIYYRGTFSAKQAMMVSSQLNIHDEVDASDASVITQYETRQQAEADGWRWYFSHPSLQGHGVDVYWQQSDKKEWFIRCEYCKHEQILTWPQNIDTIRKVYICSACSMELFDKTRKNGEWRPTATGAFSGYHISQLMCPWISAEKILEAKDDPMKDEQYFYNYVLGLPYTESTDKISPETVLKNVREGVNSQQGRIIIGVDTGLPIYLTCMNSEGVFFARTCPEQNPYGYLESLLLRWPQAVIVSDQGGDLIGIRELQQKYPGRVFLVYYRKDRKTSEPIRWADGGDVIVDRNQMMQIMVEQLRDTGRIVFNGKQEDWKPYAQHFGNIYRTKKETPYGIEYIWERNGPDHYVHTLLYALVGHDRFKDQAAMIIGNDWLEEIPVGRDMEI